MTRRIMSALALAALTWCLAMPGVATGRVAEAQTQEPAATFVDLSVAITETVPSTERLKAKIVVSNHGTVPAYDVQVDLSSFAVHPGGQHRIFVDTIDAGKFTSTSNASVEPAVWRIERIGPQTSYTGIFRAPPQGNDSLLYRWKASVDSATFESENRMQNNKAEKWLIYYDRRPFEAVGKYSLTSSLHGLSTATDGTRTANFLITVARPLNPDPPKG